MKTQILATKLFIPSLPGSLVSRTGLISLLDRGLSNKLTLLSSPAGFGKTILLCEWIAQQNLRAGWLTLDVNDNDLSRFTAYLGACLRSIEINVEELLPTGIHTPPAAQLEQTMIPLINQIAQEQEKFILVLDDFHLIENQAIHDFVSYLVENQPPPMHIVISTRADPPLALAKMRAHGDLNELRLQHLRFTFDETSFFLHSVLREKPPSETVQLLYERTDGWISGLQMAAISMRHQADAGAFVRSFAGSNQYVFDYLTEEVLASQPAPMVKFLVRTSILERLTGELCDEVTGLGSGNETLQWLSDANAFILPLDETRSWYRYHPLFLDMLRARLQQSTLEDIEDLHMRACRWYQSQGLVSEAINHAIASGDHGLAADLLENAADKTLLQGEINRFLSWIERLGENTVRDRPLLTLYHAEGLLLTGMPLDKVADRLEGSAGHIGVRALMSLYGGDLQQSEQLARQALDELPQDSYFIRSAIASAMSVMLFLGGDIKKAVDGFEESIQYAHQNNNLLLEVIGTTRIAQLKVMQGEILEARQQVQKAIDLSKDRQGNYKPVAGLPLYYMAYMDYQRNDLESALERIHLAVELAERYGGFWTIDCYLTLALILQADGHEDKATLAVRHAREIAHQTVANPFDDLYSSAFEAQIHLLQGNIMVAAQWAEQRSLIPFEPTALEAAIDGFFHLVELEYLTLAQLLIAQENFEPAEKILDLLNAAMEKFGRTTSLVEHDILRAVIYEKLKEHAESVACLEKAFTRMPPTAIHRTYKNHASALVPVFARISDHPEHGNFLRQLISINLASLEKTTTGQHFYFEALSARELDVLRCLSSQQTIPEIADSLFIAVSTLRTHIRNIYGKLGVHSRFEAVSSARSIGLLK